MSFFIKDAMAEGAAATPPAGADILGFIPLIVIFVIFYFLLIRPQVKRAKEHKKLIESISKGDEVVTAGGVVGKVVDANENFVTVEVADNVKLQVQRMSVSTLLPKGTYSNS